jgi:hypothetical protein
MGFYAFRRAIAATVADAMAAKSVIRHSNLTTTTAHYINSEPAEAVRAVDKIGELFDNTNGSGRPNQQRGKDGASGATTLRRLFRSGSDPIP